MSRAAAIAALLVVLAAVAVQAKLRKDHVGALNVGLRKSHLLHGTQLQEDDSHDLYLDQKLDHFNNGDLTTWKQRYMLNNTFWKPNGPVFFVLGGEGPISPGYIGSHFISGAYAKQFGALVVALEHRFYGKSVPKNDSSTTMLRYLSSEQALADAAAFRKFMDINYKTGNSKWIIFGGSYSGCLSGWLRSKYPHLFAGAYATSAPVVPKLDFTEYLEVVSHSIGPACSDRFRAATATLENLLDTDAGRIQLAKTFNACTPIVTEKDAATFLENIVDSVAEVVQYNHDSPDSFDITQMCKIMSSNPDPVKAWATLHARTSDSCLEVSYDQSIKDMLVNGAGRSWTWQTCTEFGFFQTGETNKQPFSKRISLDYFVEMCADTFGEPFTPDTAWVRTNYGSDSIKTSNTFFPNGNVDPWHALGVLNKNPGPLSATFLINGTAHCADLYLARKDDPPSLTKAREIGLNLIKKWLA